MSEQNPKIKGKKHIARTIGLILLGATIAIVLLVLFAVFYHPSSSQEQNNKASTTDLRKPNFFFAPASIALILPDDTRQSLDNDGTTWYISDNAHLKVQIYQMKKPIDNGDLFDDEKFTAAIKAIGVTNIKIGSCGPEGLLQFNSAAVKWKWNDGSVDEGYITIVNSKFAKGKSYIVGIFTPNDSTEHDNAAYIAQTSIGKF